jgi:hypothetical protein
MLGDEAIVYPLWTMIPGGFCGKQQIIWGISHLDKFLWITPELSIQSTRDLPI